MCQKESRSSQVTESMVKDEADCGVAGGGGEFQRHHFGPWRIKELTQILRRMQESFLFTIGQRATVHVGDANGRLRVCVYYVPIARPTCVMEIFLDDFLGGRHKSWHIQSKRHHDKDVHKHRRLPFVGKCDIARPQRIYLCGVVRYWGLRVINDAIARFCRAAPSGWSRAQAYARHVAALHARGVVCVWACMSRGW